MDQTARDSVTAAGWVCIERYGAVGFFDLLTDPSHRRSVWLAEADVPLNGDGTVDLPAVTAEIEKHIAHDA